MIRIILRDLALTAGAIGVAALAAQELDWTRRTRPATDRDLPSTRHGWLYGVDTLSTDRPRRWRPATEAEAIASAASRAAGDGGWGSPS